jgi:predicted Kef-type K+ transport protein
MKEFAVGFAIMFLFGLFVRKIHIQGWLGFVLAGIICWGLGTIVLMVLR